jgi:hypothetical protein
MYDLNGQHWGIGNLINSRAALHFCASSEKVVRKIIKPNKGKLSVFEPPGVPPLFYPLSLTASLRKPLSRNAFLNSSFKNTPSILPQFTPKKWQFFASLMFGPSLDLLPSIALLRRMGGGWDLDLAVFLNALAPATPVNRRQGRSNPVNQFQEKKDSSKPCELRGIARFRTVDRGLVLPSPLNSLQPKLTAPRSSASKRIQAESRLPAELKIQNSKSKTA